MRGSQIVYTLDDRVPACSYFRTVLLSGRRVVVAQPRGVAQEGSNGCRRGRVPGRLRQGWADRRTSPRPRCRTPISVCDQAHRRTFDDRIAEACCVCLLREPAHPSRAAAQLGNRRAIPFSLARSERTTWYPFSCPTGIPRPCHLESSW